MRRTCLLAAGLACLVPAAARGDWVVGVRSGYALPLGDYDATSRMSDLVTGQIPIQLDAGWRFRRLTLGGYASYGFGSVAGAMKDQCDAANQRCSSTSLRIGGQIAYSFAQPYEPLDPWIAVGIGYEGITVKRYTSETRNGSEWAILQGGLDWRLSTATSVGAFASLSFGTYTDVSGGSQPGVITNRGVHEWVTLGLRGSFVFGS